MAVDMFLELDGVKGESVDAVHKDKIDVLAWNWGMSNTGTFHNGSGGGAGRANFKTLSIKKYIDKASCDLMYHAASGKRIAKGSLILRKAGGRPLDYFIFSLTNTSVANVQQELSDERGTETIAFNFSKIEAEYKMQDERGLGKAGGMFVWEPKSFEVLPPGKIPPLHHLVMLPPSTGDGGYYIYGTPGDGAGQFGRPETINLIVDIADQWSQTGAVPFGVGNISLHNGGYFPPHSPTGGHTKGLGFDMRPVRIDDAQLATTWKDSAYDRAATQRLVNLLMASGRVRNILFNDAKIRGVSPFKGHDNHLHVNVRPL